MKTWKKFTPTGLLNNAICQFWGNNKIAYQRQVENKLSAAMMMISNICNMQYQKRNLWTQRYMISWCCTSSFFIPNLMRPFLFEMDVWMGEWGNSMWIWGNKGASDQRRWRWSHGCLHSEEARLEEGFGVLELNLFSLLMVLILPSGIF